MTDRFTGADDREPLPIGATVTDPFPPRPPIATGVPLGPPPAELFPPDDDGDDLPPRRRHRGLLAVVGGLLVVALLAAAFGVGWTLRDDSSDVVAAPDVAADAADRPSATPLDQQEPDLLEPVAAVADVVAPTVVQLETATGVGSGVIYDPDGLILTAAHVVEGSTDVNVRLADGTVVDGEVLGADADSDIGVVRIDPDGLELSVAVLADEVPDVGDLAVAVGSPFALDQTVTAGIVSALDRPAPSGDGPTVGTLQTDAPINPGNSGGPLANRNGEIIGIASYIQSQTGGNIGLGFAIPVDIAERVADALVAGQTVAFGYLGVEGGDSVSGQTGALVASVVPGAPAAAAGLEAGDVILAIDGQPTPTFGDLGVAIRQRAPGDEVDLTVVRGGEEQQLTVTLGSTAD